MGDPGCWKHQHIEHARRSLVTREAQARMAGKTARQQLADALDASRAPRELPEPDDGDDASTQRGVLR
jgi:sRNA-binding protein